MLVGLFLDTVMTQMFPTFKKQGNRFPSNTNFSYFSMKLVVPFFGFTYHIDITTLTFLQEGGFYVDERRFWTVV